MTQENKYIKAVESYIRRLEEDNVKLKAKVKLLTLIIRRLRTLSKRKVEEVH